MSRRGRGEGSIYLIKDGRWEGAAYLPTASGKLRRIRIYGKTRTETAEKLTLQLADAKRGIPAPEQSWTVGAYLDYFIQEVAPKTLRPATISGYSDIAERHLKPMLGSRPLTRLTVTGLQQVFDGKIASGMSIPIAMHAKVVLSAALTRAMREDIIVRNVARLLVLPHHERKVVEPWSADEAARFVAAVRSDELYPAFLLLLLYGMRKGEVLGLQWADIDWNSEAFRIRQQRQIIRGRVYVGPVKTSKGKRQLPLLTFVRQALNQYQATVDGRPTKLNRDGFVFIDESGAPIQPSYLHKAFIAACKRAGVRQIRIHDLRHTAATLLKNYHVPDRDIQLILGHSRVSITQEIYQHADTSAQQEALSRLEDRLLLGVDDSSSSRQTQPSKRALEAAIDPFQQGQIAIANVRENMFSTKISYLRRDPSLTSVLKRLRIATNSYTLGAVAVRNSRHPNEANLALWEWIPIREALTPLTTTFTNPTITPDVDYLGGYVGETWPPGFDPDS
ncbi:tyrosine-type recombinase/integrase [Nocardia salmonicida]|uniref:tyrosine-type recombinase/integrase n=1 Tax=Nocardia salmonicida TaxID=53431 RepID=UPI0033EE920C